MIASVLMALAISQGAAGGAAAPAASGQRLFLASGNVEHAGDENGGWFQFAYSHQRFRLPADEAAAGPLVQLIIEASHRGMAVQVRYDAWAGRADAAGFVEYPLCSASIATGPSVGDERANCPAGAGPPAESSGSALGLGLALSAAHPAEARPLLGRALGDPQLSRPLRAAALDARAEAAETIAATLPFAGEAFDRAAADALADDRAWVAIAPDDPEPRYAVARLLADLGGYAEAEALYRAIGRQWPNEAFNVAVRTGALYRRQGRYAEALRALDDYVAREGPQDGMKLHYHRAWTLTLLDRPAEAVDELTRGLATQPDYAYAFFMRSCAYGRLGRIGEALADQERGLELLRSVANESGSLLGDQLGIAVESEAALRQLAVARSSAPTAIACDRLWAREIRARARSALLPPPAG